MGLSGTVNGKEINKNLFYENANKLEVCHINNDAMGSIKEIYTEPNSKRVQYIYAVIHRRHLDTGSEVSKKCRKILKESYNYVEGDACGHIIARRLGGTGNDIKNLFPQNSQVNNTTYKSMEARVYNHVKSGTGCYTEMHVRLDYDDSNNHSTIEKRPYRIIYLIVFKDAHGQTIRIEADCEENPKSSPTDKLATENVVVLSVSEP
ncbi:unnamed protein product [Rotaria sp. Silwood2]|nr:unnamed protein product [Rotaria sp. Silwood2]CAF4247032.1 unnamed protein product [Rotaria sp. Silwood2]